MRQVAIVLALLFVFAPLAIAGPDDACDDECQKRCDAEPKECQPDQQPESPEPRDQDRPEDPQERDENRSEDKPEREEREFEGKWVEFSFNGAIEEFTVDDVLILESITHPSPFEAKKDGARMFFALGDDRLLLTDSRTGLLTYKGSSPLSLSFPEGTTFDGAQVTGPEFFGRIQGDYDIQGVNVTSVGELKFHVVPEPQDRDKPEVRDQMAQAIEKRQFGGEVRVQKGSDEVLVYDDVNVTVSSQTNAVRVVFDAELESGRTFVVDVDQDLLTGPDLVLQYYDIHDDGTETEVVFRMAESLADILNPDDDTGQPEYWIVEDVDGLQVMVSVPRWSVHAITVSSIGEFVTQPSVLIGAVAGMAGVGVAALAMIRPRRD